MTGFIRLSMCLVLLSSLAVFSPAFGAEDELISVDDNGQPLRGEFSSISADGRYVVFSWYNNNFWGDNVYVRDRQTGRTELANVSSEGSPGNYSAYAGVISADGRYVTFYSFATNLVPGLKTGLYLRDRVIGKTEKIDVTMDGGQHNSTGDGIFWVNGPPVTMSSDGRFVAFQSNASNLIPADINGVYHDIFVRDRQTGITELISVDSNGGQMTGSSYSPAISGDGRFVAFFFSEPLPPHITYIYIRDRVAGTTERIAQPVSNKVQLMGKSRLNITPDGRFLTFTASADNVVPDDTNGLLDLFVYDRVNKVMEKVSTRGIPETSSRGAFWPSISADGRFVAFYSEISNVVPDDNKGGGAFVRDRMTGIVERVGKGRNEASGDSPILPTISADGRFVVYRTSGNGYKIYLHDRQKITANACPDQTLEQSSADGALVTLDGSTSASGCSDPLTYTWSWSGGSAEGVKPVVQLPAGETTVTLKVSACGTSATDTVVIKVADTLPPVSTATVTGTKGSDDWFVSGATVTITATDSGSGVKEIHYRVNDDAEKVIPGAAGSFNLGTDGNYSITYYAVDNAGIPEGEKSPLNVKVDTTPPVSAVTVDGTAGLNGWYTSAATLSFTVSDNLSGVREIHYSSNPNSEIIVTGAAAGLTLTADGSYNVSYYAIDTAGNVEIPQKDQAVNIDATPPNIIIGGATNGATYSLGLVPIASYTVSDAASGVAASNAALSGGDSFGLGAFTYSVTAEDNAGNSAFADASYEVIATPEGLTALIGQLLTSGKIGNTGIANSLISKLENAQKANGNAADNIMQAFINQVEAQSGGRISSDAAAILIHAAEYIISN